MVLDKLYSYIVAAALGTFALASAQTGPQSIGETELSDEMNGHRFYGTWWLNFGPPPQRPLILTMTRSGAFILEDSVDGGGYTPTGASFSLTQGTWTRTGAKSARALGLRFVYISGRTPFVERVRLSFSFGQGFDRIQGGLQLEAMSCTDDPSPLGFNVPLCPDPTIAPTEVLRGPAPFTAVRLRVDAPLAQAAAAAR